MLNIQHAVSRSNYHGPADRLGHVFTATLACDARLIRGEQAHEVHLARTRRQAFRSELDSLLPGYNHPITSMCRAAWQKQAGLLKARFPVTARAIGQSLRVVAQINPVCMGAAGATPLLTGPGMVCCLGFSAFSACDP